MTKPRFDLLPIPPIREILAVLSHGASLYGDNDWQSRSDWRKENYSAALRHLTSWWEGEIIDPDSGCHHLAHAACRVMFLLWHEMKKREVSL